MPAHMHTYVYIHHTLYGERRRRQHNVSSLPTPQRSPISIPLSNRRTIWMISATTAIDRKCPNRQPGYRSRTDPTRPEPAVSFFFLFSSFVVVLFRSFLLFLFRSLSGICYLLPLRMPARRRGRNDVQSEMDITSYIHKCMYGRVRISRNGK